MPATQRVYALVEVLLEHGQGTMATSDSLEDLMRATLMDAVGIDEEFMTGVYNRQGEPTSYVVTDCKVVIIEGQSAGNVRPKIKR